MSWPGVAMSASEAATYRPSAGESKALRGLRGEPVEREPRERAHAERQAVLVHVEAGAVVGRGGPRVALRRRASHEEEEAGHFLLVEGEVLRAADLVDDADVRLARDASEGGRRPFGERRMV